jgi:uncharacterized protein YndB with AHSA1/START domain
MADMPDYDIEASRIFDAPPDRLFGAFADPDAFARWYGPVGFPAHRDTVEIDPRVGGLQRFTMVAEFDPSFRTAFDGRFTEVVEGELLVSTGSWTGIPGHDPWPSNLRVELQPANGKTRLRVLEGPHPPGTTDLGRQSWEMMFDKLEALLKD